MKRLLYLLLLMLMVGTVGADTLLVYTGTNSDAALRRDGVNEPFFTIRDGAGVTIYNTTGYSQ